MDTLALFIGRLVMENLSLQERVKSLESQLSQVMQRFVSPPVVQEQPTVSGPPAPIPASSG